MGILLAALVAGAVGCAGPEPPGVPGVDCAIATVPSFEDLLILRLCRHCHSSSLEDGERKRAPVEVNFDTYEATRASIDDAQETVFFGTMPPDGADAISEELKTALYTWAQCGMPP